MTGKDLRKHTIGRLAQRLRRIEGARRGRPDRERAISTGIAPLDELLPAGGLRPGRLVEWLSEEEGCGAATLALISLRPTLQAGGTLLVVDEGRDFYPPAAAGWGVELENTLVVRPGTPADALWAVEQSLGSEGAAVTFGRLGRIGDRAFRRLQLAAEKGGGLGVLLRPGEARRRPSWADLRLWVEPLPTEEGKASATLSNSTLREKSASGRRLRVEVLRCHGGAGRGAVDLEVCDETGLVRLAPELAPAASPRRKTGA